MTGGSATCPETGMFRRLRLTGGTGPTDMIFSRFRRLIKLVGRVAGLVVTFGIVSEISSPLRNVPGTD
jgi:hypothetical protein